MNELNEKDSEYTTIDIMELLETFWQRKFLILAFMIAGLLLSFVKVTYFTADEYTANGILYVSNKKELLTTRDEAIQKNDIDSSRSLGLTYIEVLKTRSFLMDISDSVDNKYTWQQIKRMMTVSAVNETELISVTVNANSPDDAFQIADNIIQKAPDKLTGVFNRGEVEIVDHVLFPTAPIDKGLTKNLALGLIIGLVLGAALVFIRTFFDTKVHKSEDVASRYSVSILGELAQ